MVFLHTNNQPSKTEIKKTISFMISSKRKKHLGVNLTKQVKIYTLRIIKALIREIGEDTNKWKDNSV